MKLHHEIVQSGGIGKRNVFVLILIFWVSALIFISFSVYKPSINSATVDAFYEEPVKDYPKDGVFCYKMKDNTLPEITEANPRKGKSIFFHETSCTSFFKGKITLRPRQACAVESAAKLNPNMDIYLLYNSPGTFRFEGTESDRILRALLSYENVHIMHLDYEKYTKGTPVEELYKSGKIERSLYAISHASDVLRFLTLWKYGGTYLDLDVIVKKSLEDLPQSYAAIESYVDVGSAVLNFAPDGQGHEHAETCLNDLKDHFKGDDWAYNGPGVITRLIKSICHVEKFHNVKECQEFHLFPMHYFFAVPYLDWEKYFSERRAKEVLLMTQNSYVLHVWNKLSASTKLAKNSTNIAYIQFAQEYCPEVFEKSDDFFNHIMPIIYNKYFHYFYQLFYSNALSLF